jgi:hypothetical protein
MAMYLDGHVRHIQALALLWLGQDFQGEYMRIYGNLYWWMKIYVVFT